MLMQTTCLPKAFSSTAADGTKPTPAEDSKRGERAEHLPFKHEKRERPSGSLIIYLVKSGQLLTAHPVSVLHSLSLTHSLSTGTGWSLDYRLAVKSCCRVLSTMKPHLITEQPRFSTSKDNSHESEP